MVDNPEPDILTSDKNAVREEHEKKKKSKAFWSVLLRVVWLTLFVIVVSASSQIIYDYARYSSFFVNGDSMYPTLNKTATRTNLATGVTEGEEAHNGDWHNYENSSYSYTCDYGLMDCSGDYISRLKRFDIVVTYFDEDWDGDSIRSSADLKIKRLYAFPGESFYFDSDGQFYLKTIDSDAFELIEQPSTIVEDGYLSNTTLPMSSGKSEEDAITLGEDEYYVIGDNRRSKASQDSREKGPLGQDAGGSNLIKGIAVAITGASSLRYVNGQLESSYLWSRMLLPWDIRFL